MSAADVVFEPLRRKERTVRQGLTGVAERWAAGPLDDLAARGALEDAIRHLLRRGEIRRELPPGADVAALARAFVAGLLAGQGTAAVARLLGAAGDASSL